MAARGDHAGAEDEFRDVLPHLERRLGPDHQVTLIVRFRIAREMAACGDHAGAEDEFRHVLPDLRRRLGPDHPDTLEAAEWIDYIQEKKDDRTADPRGSSRGAPSLPPTAIPGRDSAWPALPR
jgi:hypothetical protein